MPKIANAPAKPKAAKAKAQPTSAESAPVVHPEIVVKKYVGDKALTAKDARAILGWTETEVKDDATVVELVSLTGGKFVHMKYNTHNRYLTPSWLLTLKQEHLNRRWRLNGETIVVGRSGQVLSGQHRLISLVLADLEYQAQKAKWESFWPDHAPTMETIVVLGVDDGDETFRTLNSGKPGTLAEVLYRSDYFSDLPGERRKEHAKATGHAVKMLWARTRAKDHAFAPRRTAGEDVDFIERHPSLAKGPDSAIRHILKLNGADGLLAEYASPGYAAAMLYLMAASGADLDQYIQGEPTRAEKHVGLKYWEEAREFWEALADGRAKFKPVREALGRIKDPETSEGGTLRERLALLVKAWLLFAPGKKLSVADIIPACKPVYDDDGELIGQALNEFPLCSLSGGGIDQGERDEASEAAPDADADGPGDDPADEDDLEDRKEAAVKESERLKAIKAADKRARDRRNGKGKPAAEPAEEADEPEVMDAKPAAEKTLAEHMQDYKDQYDGALVLFLAPSGAGNFWAQDASAVAKLAGRKVERKGDTARVTVPKDEVPGLIAQLVAAGKRVAAVSKSMVEGDPDDVEIHEPSAE